MCLMGILEFLVNNSGSSILIKNSFAGMKP